MTEPNKRQKRSLFDCEWEFKQEAPLRRHQNATGSILIKQGNTQFAQMNRSQFITTWVSMANNKETPIYEVVVTDCGQFRFYRFYCDIEMLVDKNIYFDEKAWLLELLDIIKKKIVEKYGVSEEHVNDIKIIRDTRDEETEDTGDSDCVKLSYHLVWSSFGFGDNDQEMQSFANEHIKTELEKKRKFLWIAQQKKGPMTKTAIDTSVYCRNKAFRVCFAPKKPNAPSYLKPWDIEAWKELEFDNDEARHAYFESTLITGGDPTGCHVVPSTIKHLPQNIRNVEAKTEQTEKKQDRHQNEDQQKIAKELVSCLSQERAEGAKGWAGWAKVVWSISKIFNGDDSGLALAHEFSKMAQNYDESQTTKQYNKANGTVSFGSLVVWAKEDNHDLAVMILERDRNEDEKMPEEKKTEYRINEKKLIMMVDAHRKEWSSIAKKCEEGELDATQKKLMNEEKKDLKEMIIKEMNKWFCLIRRQQGKPSVVEEYHHLEMCQYTKQLTPVPRFVFRSQVDIEASYRKYPINFYGEKPSTLMKFWLSHPDSREADTAAFDPQNIANPSELNLYRGLKIKREEAIEGDISDFLHHITVIWCKGQEDLDEYILNWFAHLIQKPGKKMAVCFVLKGGQGAGKGLIIQKIAEILGMEYFIHSTNVEEITGSFQEAKIVTNLLTFLDECAFSGDKKASSMLKGIMTEETRHFNQKFVNPVRVKNCSNYIAASNHEHMIAYEKDDRRYLMIEVDSKYSGPQTTESAAYFDKIQQTSVHALAHFFYNRDISKFNPRNIPRTKYGRFQKILNFDSAQNWVYEFLKQGYLPLPPHRVKIVLSEIGETVIPKDDLTESYLYMPTQAYRPKYGKEQFLKTIYDALGCISCKWTTEHSGHDPSGRQSAKQHDFIQAT